MDLLGNLGARTVASGGRGGRGFPAVLAWAGLLLATACWVPPENSVHRAARELRLAELEGERDRISRRRQQLLDAIAEDEVAIQGLRDESAVAAGRRRLMLQALAQELDQLAIAEQDLAAARARLQAATAEGGPVQAALLQVQDQEARLRELKGRQQDLDTALSAATAELQALEQRIRPRLAAVTAQLERAKNVGAALQQAEAALAAAAAALGSGSGGGAQEPAGGR